jgi:hypothetical protein
VRRLSAAILALAFGAGAAPQDRSGKLPEYVVKAGFLYNFAKYVDWPEDAFEKADTPISIGIVGKDPFGEDLEKTLKNKTVKDRAFTIQRFREPAEIRKCHILFVARSEKERVAEVLKKVDAMPVLTVGEEGSFCPAGGAISILIEKDKPKLEVNPDAAESAKLTINSKLLKVATIVKTRK